MVFGMISKSRRREAFSFYGFISPWMIGFLLFTIVPMFISLYCSFHSVNVMSIGKGSLPFVGLKNYIMTLTSDDDFLKSIFNTFYFTAVKVAIVIAVSLGIAVLLNQAIPLKRVFRTLIYLPAIIPVVGATLLWQFLFSYDYSLVNYALSLMGIPGIKFLSINNAMNSIITMSVWGAVGPTMTIFIAALQAVPNDLYEAVTIDGGNDWDKFRHITIPIISPTLFYLTVTGIIGGLQAYTEMKLLTNGGPGNATVTMSMLIVNNAFSGDALGMGYACAQAWILFALTLVFTIVFFAVFGKRVYYEGGDKA